MKCPNCNKEIEGITVWNCIPVKAYCLDEETGKYAETEIDDEDNITDEYCCWNCGKNLPLSATDEFLNNIE